MTCAIDFLIAVAVDGCICLRCMMTMDDDAYVVAIDMFIGVVVIVVVVVVVAVVDGCICLRCIFPNA